MSGQEGRTALLVPVPSADPLRKDGTALLGGLAREDIPAHITILYPFLSIDRLLPDTLDAIADIVARQNAVEVLFRRFERFPRLLYLSPDPATWATALISRVAARWPETPPYAGAYDPIPHVTIAADVDEPAMETIERVLADRLPLVTTLREAWLVIHDGIAWRKHTCFPFGG